MKKVYYTYLWLREDGTPYYVGKGTGRRGFRSAAHGVHCPPDRDRIISQDFNSEEEALEAERFLVAYYGRKDLNFGPLRNLTDGGEGPTSLSDKQRKSLSDWAKGRSPSKETREKLSKAFKGRVFSAEWKKKISEAKMGHPVSEETRQKWRKDFCLKGHPRTSDNLYKNGDCIICCKARAARRKKLCMSQRGNPGVSSVALLEGPDSIPMQTASNRK